MIKKENIVIRKAKIKDIEEIYSLIEKIYNEIENKTWYSYSKKLERYKMFIKDGYSFVVCYNNKIVGYLLTYILRDDHTDFYRIIKENYPNTDDIIEVINIGLEKEYRGLGLQYKMLEKVENKLKNSRFKHLVCTVHPDNKYSLNNFINKDYKKLVKTKLYGNLDRYILVKDINKEVN